MLVHVESLWRGSGGGRYYLLEHLLIYHVAKS
jgi:hypothetical protein